MRTVATAVFRENRARYPLDELKKLDGKWVAFSADGQSIIASGASIQELAIEVRVAGHNLQDTVLERIELDTTDINLGGAELL